jgi:hypothetical protein
MKKIIFTLFIFCAPAAFAQTAVTTLNPAEVQSYQDAITLQIAAQSFNCAGYHENKVMPGIVNTITSADAVTVDRSQPEMVITFTQILVDQNKSIATFKILADKKTIAFIARDTFHWEKKNAGNFDAVLIEGNWKQDDAVRCTAE